jgi:hypothetical protein
MVAPPSGPELNWLEPAAHNGLVAGSSPAGPTTLSRLTELSPYEWAETPQYGGIPGLSIERFGGRDGFTRVNWPPQSIRLSGPSSATKPSRIIRRASVFLLRRHSFPGVLGSLSGFWTWFPCRRRAQDRCNLPDIEARPCRRPCRQAASLRRFMARASSSNECTRTRWSQIAAETIGSSAPVASISGASLASIVADEP